jgi:hypothetical protein
MLQKAIVKRKIAKRKKSKMQEYELLYHLELPLGASIDEFVEKLAELAESMGGYLGGGAVPYVERANGKKEKGHQ